MWPVPLRPSPSSTRWAISPPPSGNNPLIKGFFLLLVLGYSVLHVGYFVRINPICQPQIKGDFHRVYQEAKEVRFHWEEFREWLRKGDSFHPLVYDLILWPFTGIRYEYAAAFFYLLQFLLFPLSFFLLAQAASDKRLPTFFDYGIVALLAVNFDPFLETLAQYKVEGIEFFLICLAIIAFKKKRDLSAGALLCLATNLKYLPGILILYFLLKREVKVLRGALIGGSVLLSLLLIFCGVDRVWSLGIVHPLDLLLSPVPESNHRIAYLEWQTLSGTLNRLWVSPVSPPERLRGLVKGGDYEDLVPPFLAYQVALALKFLLGGLFIYTVRKRWSPEQREEKWPLFLLEISLALLMLAVFVQTTLVGYPILWLPSYCITGLLIIRDKDRFHLKEKLLFSAAYLLGGLVIPLEPLQIMLPPHPEWGREYYQWALWNSLPFCGYSLLGGCILLCIRRYSRVFRTEDRRGIHPVAGG